MPTVDRIAMRSGSDRPQILDEIVEQTIARDSIDIVNPLDGGQRIEQESRIDPRLHGLKAYLRGAPNHAGGLQPNRAQRGDAPGAAHAVVVSERGAGAERGPHPNCVHHSSGPSNPGGVESIPTAINIAKPIARPHGRRGYPSADPDERATARAERADFDHRDQRDQNRD